MDALITYQGNTNAEIIHSISGTISSIFLFTRIWARSTKHSGLWWDDYILIASWVLLVSGNGVSASLPSYGYRTIGGTAEGWTLVKCSATCFYLAMGLGKVAFATTLIRLSGGVTRALLWCLIALVSAFSIAVTFASWVQACGLPNVTSLPVTEMCVSQDTILWLHSGNAIITFCTDFILAYLPWTILKKIYLPPQEKWATGLSMSLVGLAGIVCIARMAVLAKVADLQARQGLVDWTYGNMMVWALGQAEASIYIIAQTVPLLRVLLRNGSSRQSQTSPQGAPSTSDRKDAKGQTLGAGAMLATPGALEDIELVQLPTSKIVATDSEEGKALKATQPHPPAAIPAPTTEGVPAAEASQPGRDRAGPDAMTDDEVHRLWMSMGLSRRAWSKSLSPEPQERRRDFGVLGPGGL